MTGFAVLISILCTAVPLVALCALDRHWKYWLMPLIALPLIGQVLRQFLDLIYISAFAGPPAISVLAPVAMLMAERRKDSAFYGIAWVCLISLFLSSIFLGWAAASGEADFNRDGQYCWNDNERALADCRLNPFLIANTFFGYAALPIIIVGPLPSLWALLRFGAQNVKSP